MKAAKVGIYRIKGPLNADCAAALIWGYGVSTSDNDMVMMSMKREMRTDVNFIHLERRAVKSIASQTHLRFLDHFHFSLTWFLF